MFVACGRLVSVGLKEINNSVVVVGGSLRSCWWCWWWFSGGHVVLTAGEAEIRDGLGGTEGGGGTWSLEGDSFAEDPTHVPPINTQMDIYTLTLTLALYVKYLKMQYDYKNSAGKLLIILKLSGIMSCHCPSPRYCCQVGLVDAV